MKIIVRPARESDSELFCKWYGKQKNNIPDLLQFPESYILCAFVKSRIIGFMVVRIAEQVQILASFVSDPEASDLEKALASRELVSHVITFGYLKNLSEICFLGDNPDTNRIAKHIFKETPPQTLESLFGNPEYPVYRLKLGELE